LIRILLDADMPIPHIARRETAESAPAAAGVLLQPPRGRSWATESEAQAAHGASLCRANRRSLVDLPGSYWCLPSCRQGFSLESRSVHRIEAVCSVGETCGPCRVPSSKIRRRPALHMIAASERRSETLAGLIDTSPSGQDHRRITSTVVQPSCRARSASPLVLTAAASGLCRSGAPSARGGC